MDMDIVYFKNKLITNKTKQKAFQIFVYLFWEAVRHNIANTYVLQWPLDT